MPARKPTGLNTQHYTAAERDERESADAALRPGFSLPRSAPAQLKNHEIASSTWRRVMRTYADIDAEIVTYLDLDLLLDYCLLVEQIAEMDELRAMAMDTWRSLKKRLENIAAIDPETLENLLGQLNDVYEQITKIDGRADRKRALLLQLRQSLYLTPRARAAASPKRKDEKEKDNFGDEFD